MVNNIYFLVNTKDNRNGIDKFFNVKSLYTNIIDNRNDNY